MSTFEQDYLELVDEVIVAGFKADGRNGATRSVPGAHIYINLDEGFPMLTTRKMFPGGVIGELAAFVRGAEDLATFRKFGCNYWDMNAAAWPANKDKPESEWQIGQVYGSVWRNFNGVDQLKSVLHSVVNDPTSRRQVVTALCPGAESALPPCHVLFQLHVKEGGLYATVYMRSVDLCVGLPSDVVLYALLVHLIAKDAGLKPQGLGMFFGDAHCYENHVEMFADQANRPMDVLPKLVLAPEATTLEFTPDMVTFEGYNPYPAIKYPFNV